ncbi:MAG: outer membrane protein insertion porin family [Candidatus Atribacteria bacterium]|nr:outer membrane protein insertion porin family [Candidatus Atribacteria bacterium]
MTKRKWIGVLTLVLVLVGVFPVFSQESFPPVVAIRVEGNQHISERLILSAVSLSLKEPFNPEKVKNDLKAIYDLGYFSKVWVDTKKYPDGVEVIYKVEEFPVIQDIAISGNTALTTEEIRRVMIISPGQVMNWKIFQRDLERIKALYSDSGFIVAYIDGINFENGVLSFTLHEGIIEELLFEGLEKTKEYVLRRELDFEPPVVFDFARIKKNMQRIYDLGFFEDLSMRLEPGSDQEHIKVVIGVVEKKTGLAGVGIGYNTEEGWLGYVRYQEANLGGNAQKVELRYEFGSRTLYRLYFEEPWFLGDPTLLALSLYDQVKERTNYEGGEEIGKYEEERIGGQLVFGRKINEDWSWRLKAKSEKIDITVLEGEAPDRGGVTNSLSPMIIYDTRDSILDPKEGWYAS